MHKASDNPFLYIEALPQAAVATAEHRLVKIVAILDKNAAKPKCQKWLKTFDMYDIVAENNIKTDLPFCNFTIE